MLTRDEIGKLFQRWYKPIRQYLTHSVDPALKAQCGTVDDLAQEVFVRLLKYRTTAEMPPVENMQGYLFRIAANVRNEFLERAVVRRLHSTALLEELIEDDQREPHHARESEDLQEALQRCVDTLPVRQRTLFMLHINEGLTYKQIAEREGISYRIVLRSLTKAYSSMRMMMPSVEGSADTPLAPHVKQARKLEEARAAEQQRREDEHERQRQLFKQRAAAAEAKSPRHALLKALEAHGFVVSRAAGVLGMPVTTMHYNLRKYVSDLDALRLQHATNRHAEMLRTLQAHRYSYASAARALDMDDDSLKYQLRAAYPDIEERKAAWKSERRRQVTLDERERKRERERLRRKDQTAAARAAREAARASEEAMHTCALVVCGVYQHAMIRALESTQYSIVEAARKLGITESKARHVYPRLVPDFAERKARVQRLKGLAVLRALVRHRFSLMQTAQALGYGTHSGFLHYARSVLPRYDEMRAKYLRKHSMGRCGGHIETPEEHRERLERAHRNRSAAAREFNLTRRWGTPEHRHAQVTARLQKLEEQLAKLAAIHDKEKADMRNAIRAAEACLMKLPPAERQTADMQAAISALKRNYKSMRERQVKERRKLNVQITHQRLRIPNRGEVFKLAEKRAAREEAGHARKLEVLDACGGNALKASLILNMHVGYVRKWKRDNWQPPELRREQDEQTAADTG